MEIYAKQVSGVTVLNLVGSIDALTAPKISEFINCQIANGKIKLVGNFKGVDYTSSAGLRVLLGAIIKKCALEAAICAWWLFSRMC